MIQLKISVPDMQSAGILIACMVTALWSAGQQPAREAALKEQFATYSRQALQEKLYLHTDKDFYLAGETCWFKIYNTDATFNMPLGISKLAYVEVLDKNKRPVLQLKVGLNNGSGNASVQWPAGLSSGKYLLRAYTSWMKNFDAAYFFEKTLTIINTRKIYTDSSARKKPTYTAQFFPEGGNLVYGLQSTVAFKMSLLSGKGVGGNGVVINEKNDTVVSFTAAHFGMGTFVFTPVGNHSYRALVSFAGASPVEYSLPAIFPAGYTMRLTKEPNGRIKVAVAASAGESPLIYLFAHTRGSIKMAAAAELQNGVASFVVDTSKLGEGVSHFTLFNASRQPVCERLFFRRPAHPIALTMKANKETYDTRDKITINIASADQTGKALPADMSMAVYRIDTLTTPGEMDISNYLWLTSDLTGQVESPGYYFAGPADSAAIAADNLMMTQGWRRFRWEDLLQNKKPVFQFAPEYKGHIVKGKVIGPGGLPAKSIESFLSVPGTKTQFRDAFSDDSGLVKFEMNNFYGNDEIVVQTSGQEDGKRHVEIANPFAEQFSAATLPSFALPVTQPVSLATLHLGMQVQNNYMSGRVKQYLPAGADTMPFYSIPDKAYWLDDYVRFTTVEEILREYVPDVNVRKKEGKFQLPVFDNIRKEFFRISPLILLDGVPVLDADKIMSYDPLKIKKLEVVARMYYYGNMFFGGIINFITYNGDFPGFELDPHATVIDYGTLQLQREFFSPSYDTPERISDRLPDFRNLLYWSPDIKTSATGNTETVFYTSDVPGRFAAVLEGMTNEGKTGTKTIFFTVREKDEMAGNRQQKP